MINKILLYFLIAAATIGSSHAQTNLKLSKVKKMELRLRPGGLSNDSLIVEVVKDPSGWAVYQLHLVKANLEGGIKEHDRKFLRKVPAIQLEHLLKTVNKADTNIHKEFFDLSAISLTKALDSLYPGMSKSIRASMVKDFRSNEAVSKALYKVLHPRLWDDRTEYDIKIYNMNGKLTKLQALSFAAVYDLPWVIDGSKLYDPNISLIFNSLIGNDKYPVYQKLHVKDEVIREMHYEIFHATLPVRR